MIEHGCEQLFWFGVTLLVLFAPLFILMVLEDLREHLRRDDCEVCDGTRGEPGNENIIDGVVMCDYCDAERAR